MLKLEKKSPRGKLNRYVWEKLGELERVLVAITLLFEPDEKLYSIEFYSSLFGILNYNHKTNKINTKAWEGEREAQAISSLNYHYTAKLLSDIDNTEISKAILEDIFKRTKEDEFNLVLLAILQKEKSVSFKDFKKWI